MQKGIKKLIESELFKYGEFITDWTALIKEYMQSVAGTAKGVVLQCRYFEKKNYWRCLRELQKIKWYSEKDNFYKLVNEIVNEIALRASYKGLLNPYEFELER